MIRSKQPDKSPSIKKIHCRLPKRHLRLLNFCCCCCCCCCCFQIEPGGCARARSNRQFPWKLSGKFIFFLQEHYREYCEQQCCSNQIAGKKLVADENGACVRHPPPFPPARPAILRPPVSDLLPPAEAILPTRNFLVFKKTTTTTTTTKNEKVEHIITFNFFRLFVVENFEIGLELAGNWTAALLP